MWAVDAACEVGGGWELRVAPMVWAGHESTRRLGKKEEDEYRSCISSPGPPARAPSLGGIGTHGAWWLAMAAPLLPSPVQKACARTPTAAVLVATAAGASAALVVTGARGAAVEGWNVRHWTGAGG